MDLERLSLSYDVTQAHMAQLENKTRLLKKRIEVSSRQGMTGEMKEDYVSAQREVALIRVIAREVRQTFSARLREAHGARGLLIGPVVYCASKDRLGIDRIELANPPKPTIEPVISKGA